VPEQREGPAEKAHAPQKLRHSDAQDVACERAMGASVRTSGFGPSGSRL